MPIGFEIKFHEIDMMLTVTNEREEDNIYKKYTQNTVLNRPFLTHSVSCKVCQETVEKTGWSISTPSIRPKAGYVQSIAVKCCVDQYSAVQCSAVQCSADQYNAVQYGAVQYRVVQ